MMNQGPALKVVATAGEVAADDVASLEEQRLDLVFAALSDPIRRRILAQLDGQSLLVSEIAASFAISLQGVSRHIQVLVRAGLIRQERSGRISRCSLDAGPLFEGAVWLNRYTKYWQGQFEMLAATLAEIDERGAPGAPQSGASGAPQADSAQTAPPTRRSRSQQSSAAARKPAAKSGAKGEAQRKRRGARALRSR